MPILHKRFELSFQISPQHFQSWDKAGLRLAFFNSCSSFNLIPGKQYHTLQWLWLIPKSEGKNTLTTLKLFVFLFKCPQSNLSPIRIRQRSPKMHKPIKCVKWKQSKNKRKTYFRSQTSASLSYSDSKLLACLQFDSIDILWLTRCRKLFFFSKKNIIRFSPLLFYSP